MLFKLVAIAGTAENCDHHLCVYMKICSCVIVSNILKPNQIVQKHASVCQSSYSTASVVEEILHMTSSTFCMPFKDILNYQICRAKKRKMRNLNVLPSVKAGCGYFYMQVWSSVYMKGLLAFCMLVICQVWPPVFPLGRLQRYLRVILISCWFLFVHWAAERLQRKHWLTVRAECMKEKCLMLI